MDIRIVRKCIEVTDKDLTRMHMYLRKGRHIFNLDKKQLQAPVRKTDPLCHKITKKATKLFIIYDL